MPIQTLTVDRNFPEFREQALAVAKLGTPYPQPTIHSINPRIGRLALARHGSSRRDEPRCSESDSIKA
jgi:hypothetical protein